MCGHLLYKLICLFVWFHFPSLGFKCSPPSKVEKWEQFDDNSLIATKHPGMVPSLHEMKQDSSVLLGSVVLLTKPK